MIIVNFTGNSNYTYAYGLWQWDYGQVLRIQGLSLPSAVEIHFSLQETGGEATPRIGVTKDGVTDVVIPDSMLEGNNATANYSIYVFIYLTDDTSGETIKKIKLNVNARPKPEGRSGDDTTTMAAILKAVNEIADAKVTVVDKELSEKSTNPVENKVVTEELSRLSLEIAKKITVPDTAEVGQTIVVSEVDENGNKKTTMEQYTENETVNSMVPIWQRAKSEISDEECKSFYKEHFFDMEDPARIIRVSAEGAVDYKAMLFIPAKAPYGYFTKDYEKGLQLYTSGVMIMDKCADLLPEHFRFVKGVVDSQNLSLNISREILQHDKQLKVIANNLEKKIKSELKKMMTDDREGYDTFYKAFGIQLKYGVVNDFGMHKDLLSDLLMFYSSTEKKMVSLAEYVSRMPQEQKFIYFASGETVTKIDQLPQTELVKEKGYEILYMTDSVDDFVVQMLMNYEEKQFKSVNDKDLGLETDEEKKEAEKKTEESKELLDFVKGSLDGKVASVRFSTKLKSHPVCLTTD